MYIGDYLGRREIYSPEKLAIIDTGKNPVLRLTYRQMNTRANQFAYWLKTSVGIQNGDRVAILARDGVEHLDCFFACGKLGAVHTALNWRLHWREIVGIFENTTPRVLIYSDDFKSMAENIQAELANTSLALKAIVHLEGDGLPGSQDYAEILNSTPVAPIRCETLTEEDTACLLFTGGTTGLPKAAMISHRMICWNVLNTVIHDLHHDDIYLNVYPLFHAGGLFAYLSSQIVFGNTSVLTRQFNPDDVLDLIEREQVTVFAGVPTMYQMIAQSDHWEKADLSSLRFCTSGGAPLPVPLIDKYIQEKNIKFKQGFGMTEFGPGLFALAPEDAIRKAGSIGRPNFFVDVRVVNEQNQPLGPNEEGELVLNGPSRCSGYFNNPKASAAAIDAEGWFHTGDIVRYDDEWYFYVVDRKKDMFISGGENVYPVEIENILYRHPAVSMCAVIGVPDPKWGEVGKALVVLKPDQNATEDELMALMLANLARYKVPRSIKFIDALPLSGMGKILKRELREKYTHD
jgi:fatty-acyl-CoA synthase